MFAPQPLILGPFSLQFPSSFTALHLANPSLVPICLFSQPVPSLVHNSSFCVCQISLLTHSFHLLPFSFLPLSSSATGFCGEFMDSPGSHFPLKHLSFLHPDFLFLVQQLSQFSFINSLTFPFFLIMVQECIHRLSQLLKWVM